MHLPVLLLLLLPLLHTAAQPNKPKGVYLEKISFDEAEKVLTPETVVVIPVGAAAKQHGLHLPMNSDFLQAEFFKRRITEQRPVVMAPTFSYSYYPIFLQFGGSTSLRYTTARDALLEIVRQLAAHGPKRFYIINQGITTNVPLAEVKALLAAEGIALQYSDFSRGNFASVENSIRTVHRGSHADEIETSNVLYVAPAVVKMQKAVNDTSAQLGGISIAKTPIPHGMVSPTGVYGFGKLATKEKGRRNMEGVLRLMLHEIDSLQKVAPPGVADRSVTWAEYAGTYTSPEGKRLTVTPKAAYLDYTWDNRDHSPFYHLYYYNPDLFASQLLDVYFLRQDGKVQSAVCNYRGQRFVLTRQGE